MSTCRCFQTSWTPSRRQEQLLRGTQEHAIKSYMGGRVVTGDFFSFFAFPCFPISSKMQNFCVKKQITSSKLKSSSKAKWPRFNTGTCQLCEHEGIPVYRKGLGRRKVYPCLLAKTSSGNSCKAMPRPWAWPGEGTPGVRTLGTYPAGCSQHPPLEGSASRYLC